MTQAHESPLAVDFEAACQELEVILEKMSHSQVSLEESLSLYEKAGNLIHFCEDRLRKAEERIEILTKRNQKEPLVEPFEHQHIKGM